jgi:C4-dicarboxylate-binding protein DctP
MRISLIATVLLAATSAWAQAADPIVIRFSHVVAESTPKGYGATLLKKRVEEKLGGRVRVQVYPRAQKFNDDEALVALTLGDIELAAPSFSKFRAFTEKLQVFDLPFVFADVDAVQRFQQSSAGHDLLDAMLDKGIKGLAFWDNGMRVMSANRPLRLPADAEGLRFRIEPSPVMEAQYQALGVATVPLPFKDVAEALKSGLVDGQENAWSNIYSQGFHDYQEHFTEVDHSFLGYMLVTTNQFWDTLPADIRTELQSIIGEVTEEVNKIARYQVDSDRQKVIDSREAKLVELSEPERSAWRDAMQPVREQFAASIGEELLAAVAQANGAEKSEMATMQPAAKPE